jgi:hypothetical protein
MRTETDPVSETLCFLVSRIADDGQRPKTQYSENDKTAVAAVGTFNIVSVLATVGAEPQNFV